MATRKDKSATGSRPRWTDAKPTQAGWYWYRGCGEETDLLIVQIDEAGYFQWPDGGFSEARLTDGQWAGPLDPPEDL